MEPVKFKGANIVFGESQPEYKPLPAFRNDEGIVLTCWKCTLRERLKILFTGRMYLQQLTFNNALQPILPVVYNPLEQDELITVYLRTKTK